MFDELLKSVSVNISTVRKIINTNDRLRGIVFRKDIPTQQESDENTQFTKLIQGLPSEQEWLVYDRCAVVTRLYAIYERFVEDLIAEWLELLPDIVTEYSDLEKSIKDTHQIGVGRLLLDLKKKRFEHLSINEVIQGLFDGVTAQGKYKLIPDAFLLHEQNLRREVLEKLFADAGISNAWDWVNKHRTVKQFVEEVLGSQNTAEGELNELITYRNDAAHGSIVDDTVGTKELLELGEFVEILCQSLAELVTFKVISRQTGIGKAKEIGQITEWFKKPRAGVAKVKEITLSVGKNIFLVNEASSFCQLATIENIMINDVCQEQVVITNEQEVGLKFDIDAKKGLSIYVVE
ncbi:MAG: MAE_28990/MAE_18760 family HEPN-like nuclease [Microcoleus sp.]